MFDVSWQEILVIGVVALIVVGPKELPTLLRTVGKYVGAIKRQASEFRAQFDEAMRESELDQIRKDVEKIKTDTEDALRNVEQSVDTHISGAKREFDDATNSIAGGRHPDAHDANGLPFPVDDQGQLPPSSPSTAENLSSPSPTPVVGSVNDEAVPPPSTPHGASESPPASPSPGSSSNASGTSPAKANA